jgi:thioredoxin 1
MVATITDSTFEKEVINSELPVLVDFWAAWCGPCRLVAPTVDEVATDFDGRLKVVKINVDDYPHLASQYGIRSLPTLAIFKNGQIVDRVVGAVPKTTVTKALEKYF